MPFSSVLQFEVALAEIEPRIWRRIQVPESYTFWDLHVAIQDAMGWQDCHLHEFALTDPVTQRPLRVGIPDEDFPVERPTEAGWKLAIAPFFPRAGARVKYVYDLGDDWLHVLTFEGRSRREAEVRYPRCTGGERACPPEDVGGVPGYEEFLRVIGDPEDEEHEAMRDWVGGGFDPERFSAAAVKFDDPRERWAMAFGRR